MAIALPAWRALQGFPVRIAGWTLAHAVTLAGNVPVLAGLAWWFFPFEDKPLHAFWVVPALFLLGAVLLFWLFRRPRTPAVSVAALVLLGYAVQMGLGWAEGRGLDGIRDRIRTSGHAEFARVAVRVQDTRNVLSHYEEFARDGRLGDYGRTKPPGQLLLYVATARVANWLNPLPPDKRLRWLETFAALTWPLATFLVLWPMYRLGRWYGGHHAALVACALYTLVPSVALVTLHTDGVFFPLLAATAAVLALTAARRRSALRGCLAGAWMNAALFFSFSLVCLLPALLLAPVAYTDAASPWKVRLRSAARVSAGFAAGFVLAGILLLLLLDYDPLQRWQAAMSYHAEWKSWSWSLRDVLNSGLTNLAEFGSWLGVPALGLYLVDLRRVGRGPDLRRLAGPAIFTFALLAALVAAAFLGTTRGETARLWLFAVPFVCLSAGRTLSRLEFDRRHKVLALMLLLEAGTTVLIKRYQDFW
ncbi:MAG: hypothetical protein HY907_07170 [Deltaproteobacteria bacterium]|nr:hypothetical protein [Deltaproteobacteria bacterium]